MQRSNTAFKLSKGAREFSFSDRVTGELWSCEPDSWRGQRLTKEFTLAAQPAMLIGSAMRRQA
jgi:hypothetical protein